MSREFVIKNATLGDVVIDLDQVAAYHVDLRTQAVSLIYEPRPLDWGVGACLVDDPDVARRLLMSLLACSADSK